MSATEQPAPLVPAARQPILDHFGLVRPSGHAGDEPRSWRDHRAHHHRGAIRRFRIFGAGLADFGKPRRQKNGGNRASAMG
jgi:hypothetical protein